MSSKPEVLEYLAFSVLQEDIDAGTRSHYGKCPIALAIKRAANTSLVEVASMVHIRNIPYSMTWETRHFIDLFDEGDPVEPSRFIITKKK